MKDVIAFCEDRNNVCGMDFSYMQNLPLPNIPAQGMG
jgi:hypothetical protein